MSSWKANCSRRSATRSRVAVIESPEGAPRRAPGLAVWAGSIPSPIIGIDARSVNDGGEETSRRRTLAMTPTAVGYRWLRANRRDVGVVSARGVRDKLREGG